MSRFVISVGRACFAVAAGTIFSLVGCSSDDAAPAVDTNRGDNLIVIQRAYQQAYDQLGRPPGKKDEISSFLPAGESPEKVFVSPSDGQEYVILWGTDSRNVDTEYTDDGDVRMRVVGYEREGRDGVRFVFTVHGVVTMTEKDFRNAVFPPGHQP